MARRAGRASEARTSSDRPRDEAALPPLVLTCAASREVDVQASTRYGIPGLLLMENAGREIARVTAQVAAQVPAWSRTGTVVIWCGPGNNGGDGYAAARHLHNTGLRVALVPVGIPRLGSDAAINAEICRTMGLTILDPESAESLCRQEPTVIVDALLGTGLTRAPEGAVLAAIETINAIATSAVGSEGRSGNAGSPRATVVSVDIPSGLDADSGLALGAAIVADTTVTMAAPKQGLIEACAAEHVGRLEIADIGVPRELILSLGERLPRRRGVDAAERR